MKKQLKQDLMTLLFVTLSALVYSISMKVFVESGNLFPGGFSGISTLISRILLKYGNIQIPFSVFYFLLNVPPTILVYKYIGKRFTIFSVIQFTLTSFFVQILPSIAITSDIILIAVFGGILCGVGLSFALRANASSGGMDFIAIYTSTKANVPTWSYVFYLNASILLVAGLLFGWEQALYSIIFQFCSTQIVSTMHNRFKLNSLFIVTENPDEVSEAILKTCRHGITKLWGEGVYSHTPRALLYMTCNAYQVNEICHAIHGVDARAFINISKTERILGNYYQKPLD